MPDTKEAKDPRSVGKNVRTAFERPVDAGAERRLPSFRVPNAKLRTLGWTSRCSGIASGLDGAADTLHDGSS